MIMDNEPEKFEIAARILGNEVFAFSISSQSQRKNWIVIGTIVMTLTVISMNYLLPLIQYVMG